MQEIKKNLPLILLIGLCPYLFYKEPNLAQSLILVGLSGLVGFKYYLESKEEPDYKKMFELRLNTRDQELDKKIKEVNSKIETLNLRQGNLGMVNTTKKGSLPENFGW